MGYDFAGDALIASFRSGGAWFDDEIMALRPIEGMGFGAIAKQQIEANTPLFHIPLSHLLTPWTSELRTHLKPEEWNAIQGGWAALILVMMWEESRGDASPWAGYLANMPRDFGTPMFWNDAEREALRGTDIQDRIGRDDAEAEFHAKLAPLIAARPDLFPTGSEHFTLESYHAQGSRILSRSFTVPLRRAGCSPDEAKRYGRDPEDEDDEDDSDEDEDEKTVAVMVPMADMLNAAYERDNARLFDDEEEDGGEKAARFTDGYTMITTKPIEAGEQIYNTYASPPNSELLRKYGHVDALPLPAPVLAALEADEIGTFPLGNAGDEVELRGDDVVRAAASALHPSSEAAAAAWLLAAEERVDWWLEEGMDDTFGLAYPVGSDGDDEDDEEAPAVVAPPLVPFVRVLVEDEDWARAKRGKSPKSALTPTVLSVLAAAIRARATQYPQDIAADLAAIASDEAGSKTWNAAVVRIGEKRVLAANLRYVEREAARLQAEAGAEKRKAPGKDSKDKKRRK